MTYGLLVEVGVEELPYSILLSIAHSFIARTKKELYKLNLSYGSLAVFTTPRRLCLKANRLINLREPHNLYEVAYSSIKALSSFKVMCWNEAGFKFIRPLHTLTILLNNKIIPGSLLGVISNRKVNGHRFIGEKSYCINHANSYLKLLLEKGKVIAAYRLRLKIVFDKTKAIAKKTAGFVKLDASLLAEVTCLVEWPVVLIGSFKKSFLIIPKELLVFTIKTNQKYNPVYETKDSLLPYFIFVSNVIPNRISKIVSDNQKVICPRLADALWFLNIDRKKNLEYFIPELNTILFEKRLGTLRGKSHRIEFISSWVSHQIGANHIDSSRAGLLSKCDLVTKLVYEFKDIYGFVGKYHAKHDGENKEVSLTLMEQYLPRGSNDILPTTLVACSVAISDKAVNIIGIIGVYGLPKGNKDPYSLKRFIIGLFRIIIENKILLNLKDLLIKAANIYGNKLITKVLINIIIAYYMKKIAGWYQSLGYNNIIISSVSVLSIKRPINIHSRICLLKYMQKLKGFKYIIEANKRITNIILKTNAANKSYILNNVNKYLLRFSEEVSLYKQLIFINKKLEYLLYSLSFQEASTQLIKLCKYICVFFKRVLVIDKPESTRINRLILLKSLKDVFIYIADISLYY